MKDNLRTRGKQGGKFCQWKIFKSIEDSDASLALELMT